jgi:hypothetical protein
MLSPDEVFRMVRRVDLSSVLPHLEGAVFADTGGTNGWLMVGRDMVWADEFVRGLALGGTVLRTFVRKLPARQGIPPHIDPRLYRPELVREQRFHVPLVTHPAVRMRWPDAGVEAHLEAGCLYEVRYDVLHEVVHDADVDRVHVHVDVANAAV